MIQQGPKVYANRKIARDVCMEGSSFQQLKISEAAMHLENSSEASFFATFESSHKCNLAGR